ncbi:MAG: hypothetical protein Q9159_005613 [Coniocarpon cinnabarinum]
MDTYSRDLEKHPAEAGVGNVSYEKRPSYVDSDSGAVPGEAFEYGTGVIARIQRLAGRFKIEQRGIERVPEYERTDDKHPYLNVGTMWLSSNMVVSSFAIGVLGKSLFVLGFVDAILVVLFFNLLGILPLINAVNNDVPGWAGIIIIAACTWLVTIFGYKVVHIYEFWSWIPTFIVFMIVLGEFAHSGDFVNIPMGVGSSEAGSVLSFGAVVYGFATGWTSYAADYTVYQNPHNSRRKVFFATWLGLIFPLLFTEMLGVAVMTATNDPTSRYAQGYDQSGSGGLLAAVLVHSLGHFGRLSHAQKNVWMQAIPRFIWTTVATAVYIAIAIPGYSHFEEVLENFMNFIGYWLAIYEGIALSEHFAFRRGMRGYHPELYDHPDELPPGIAAVAAFIVGVVGVVMGMSQVWFIGPIAKKIGDPEYGGDIGFELGFAFAAVAYFILRPLELRFFRR